MLLIIVANIIEVYIRKTDPSVDPRFPAAVRRIQLRLDFRTEKLPVVTSSTFGVAQQSLPAIRVAAWAHGRCFPIVPDDFIENMSKKINIYGHPNMNFSCTLNMNKVKFTNVWNYSLIVEIKFVLIICQSIYKFVPIDWSKSFHVVSRSYRVKFIVNRKIIKICFL